MGDWGFTKLAEEVRRLVQETQAETPEGEGPAFHGKISDIKGLRSVLAPASERRDAIRKQAVASMYNVFPIKGTNYDVTVHDVRVDAADYTLEDMKEAVLARKSLTEPIKATVRITDKASGRVLDEQKKTLGHLPFMTDHHTFILDGNPYALSSQLRVKPGVYTRMRSNGDLESAFNLGRGANFRLFMDPMRGVFHIQYGATKTPLYPILVALGVQESVIAQAWGKDLADANRAASRGKERLALATLYAKVVPMSKRSKAPSEADMVAAIREAYGNTVLDPAVTKATLSMAVSSVTPLALLAASKKILGVYNETEQEDDRDDLQFKTLHTPDTFVKERIEKDAARGVLLRSRFKLNRTADPKVKDVLPSAPFSGALRSLITQSSLAQAPSQINPVELIDGAVKVTSLGEGGISSLRSVPESTRSQHASHLGMLDPVRTAECYDDQTEVYTRAGWVRWPDVDENAEFACLIDGRLAFHPPLRLISAPYDGELLCVTTSRRVGYAVTPNHRLHVRPTDLRGNASWRIVTADVAHTRAGWQYQIGHEPLEGDGTTEFHLPAVTQTLVSDDAAGSRATLGTRRLATQAAPPIPLEVWAEFLGWYISGGNTVYKSAGMDSRYAVRITQRESANPAECSRIEALLDALPWTWSKYADAYSIPSKQLAEYCRRFGRSVDKFLPSEVFTWPVAARERLLSALMAGDGRTYSKRKVGHSYTEAVYSTVSPQLARDVEALAIGLGSAVSITTQVDNREERYRDVYDVRVIQAKVAPVRTRRHMTRPDGSRGYVANAAFTTLDYHGTVYCATVPGGLLYVRRGTPSGHWNGNSGAVGVDLRSASYLHVDERGNMYTPLINVRTKKVELVSAATMSKSKVAFEGTDLKKTRVPAMDGGQVRDVLSKDVAFMLPSTLSKHSPSSSLVPMMGGSQGNRLIMGSKHQTQAVPLKHRQAPLVQVAAGDGTSMEAKFAEWHIPKALEAGTVQKIDMSRGRIIIAPKSGGDPVAYEFANNYPLASKTRLHHDVTLKPGDTVTKGQVLADSNFTQGGVMANGRNLHTAYMAYHGLNSNDAFVISESASELLTSEHMYRETLSLQRGVETSVEIHKRHFGSRFPATAYGNLDADGVVKSGTVIKTGDLIVAAVVKRTPSAEDAMLGRLNKSLVKPYGDASITWTHGGDGRVTEVHKSKSSVTVLVYTEEKMKVGDKLSGRFGNKGVVSKIIPDDQMPRDESGRPIELIATSAGVVSRINPAQVLERAYGKVALKTGQPILVDQYPKHSMVEHATALLKEHGVKDKETLYDPISGRSVPGIAVGPTFQMKMFKSTDTNFSTRSTGSYDVNEQPTKGGEAGAKSIGRMDFYALVGHGATNLLKESASIKGQRNDEYWKRVQMGLPEGPVKTPFAWSKFQSMLTGAGINVTKKGNTLTLAPLTDKDVMALAPRAIQNAGVVKPKVTREGTQVVPETGGLFDPVATGGVSGTKWSRIDLVEPVVNPIFEDTVKTLTGMGGKEFDAFQHGAGGHEMRKRLNAIDLDDKSAELEASIRRNLRGGPGREALVDRDVKTLKSVRALKKMGMQAGDAYVISTVPVVPPVMRGVVSGTGGAVMVSDANFLYKDLLLTNNAIRDMPQELRAIEDMSDHRRNLSAAVAAVVGTGDPINDKTKARAVRGFMQQAAGIRSPKEGYFQSRLIKRRQDLSGRGTIAPDPSLGIDSVGLPEEMMWTQFKPFVIKNLVKRGYSTNDALRMVDEKHPTAKIELLEEAKRRPILMNRAPTLHRYNMVAAYATPVDGKTIFISPFYEKLGNADYDGDAMQVHVPVTDKGIADARRMTISALAMHDGSKGVAIATPQHEAIIGTYMATKPMLPGPARAFKTRGDALAAYGRGEIKINSPITVDKTTQTAIEAPVTVFPAAGTGKAH